MAFDVNNFKNSIVYTAYAPGKWEKYQGTTENPQNPYELLQSVTLNSDLGFEYYAKDKLGEQPTYYKDLIPYFFLRFSCFDDLSEIKNMDVNFEQIKLPLKYFTTGELFGLSVILDSIKNDKSLDNPKNWNFFNSFINNGTISQTNDFKLNAEGVFYNTLYKYFKEGYYQLQLKNEPNLEYSKKGSILVDKDGKDYYSKGEGEAPNYLDVLVNSRQKVKNKAVIKLKATRTSYNSNVQPPQQIVLKRNNEELLSCLRMEQEKISDFDPPKNYFIFNLTSLSNTSLDTIINNLLKPAVLYFNVAHYILRAVSIEYKFFATNAKEDDIFYSDSVSASNLENLYSTKSIGLKNLIKKYPLYLKELLINLLNLVDPTEVGNICDKMLDYFEENNSNLNGLYSRTEFKELMITLNEMCFETFKKINPKSEFKSNDGKITNGAILTKTLSPEQIIHSNDLTLQKVYVYRDQEKPLNYDDIVQKEKLYKILELPKNSQNITINESVVLEDNIEVNKKYYYCFLSQREYDVYEEFSDLKIQKIKVKTIPEDKKEFVQHFSSPTKVLELEMISTDNSTYLDYSFFIPEDKQAIKYKTSFLKKLKISPSDVQKASQDLKGLKDVVNNKYALKITPSKEIQGLAKLINENSKLIKFWSNTSKLVASSDYATGQTIKLRITSPKTKRKLDINVRHFLIDYLSLGTDSKKLTYEELELVVGENKFYEANSFSKPEVKLTFDYPRKNQENLLNFFSKTAQYKIPNYRDNQINNLIYYDLSKVKASLYFNDPNNPKLNDFFQSWQVIINGFNSLTRKELINFIDTEESTNKIYYYPSEYSDINLYNKITFQQKFTDSAGSNPYNDLEFETNNLQDVTYELVKTSPSSTLNKGDTITFSLKINNYPANRIKKISWRILGIDNSKPTNDFSKTFGVIRVDNPKNQILLSYNIDLKVDKDSSTISTTNKKYKLVIYKNKDLFQPAEEIYLTSSEFQVIVVTPPTSSRSKKVSKRKSRLRASRSRAWMSKRTR
jgi:hypothetical protein